MESTLYLKIDGQQYRIFVRVGESLMEACNRNGIEVPQSCLRGYCSTCLCKLEKGEVKMETNLCLTENEVRGGSILTCQSYPKTEMVVINFDLSPHK